MNVPQLPTKLIRKMILLQTWEPGQKSPMAQTMPKCVREPREILMRMQLGSTAWQELALVPSAHSVQEPFCSSKSLHYFAFSGILQIAQ